MISLDARQKIEARFNALYADSSQWRAKSKDVQTYLCPMLGNFEDTPNAVKAPDSQVIINSNPGIALRDLASGLSSGMTPSSRPWFKLGLEDADLEKFRPAKIWLQKVEELMYSVIAKSNIYASLGRIYEEVPAFGIGVLCIESDFNYVVKAHTFSAGEYVLGFGPDGRVNTFGRSFWQTLAQLVYQFGEDNLSGELKSAWKLGRSKDLWVKVKQLIEPNDSQVYGARDSKAFRSTYYENGKLSEAILRESGYDTFPIMAPRWKPRDATASLGSPPSYSALGDIKMLQKLEHKYLLALDKSVDPPFQYDDSIDGEPTLMAGEGIKYSGTNPNGGVRPVYLLNLDLDHVASEKRNVEARVDRVFFRDLMLQVTSIQTQGKTAYEINKMYEEKLMILGPVLESFKDELHDPMIDRVFSLMLAAKIVPPPPPELENVNMKVDYTSILAQAQKMIGSTSIEQWYGFFERVAQINPEIKDTINADKIIETMHSKLGCPQELLRDEAEVAQIREGQQQAQETLQKKQDAASTLAGIRDLGSAKVGGGTALDSVQQNVSGLNLGALNG